MKKQIGKMFVMLLGGILLVSVLWACSNQESAPASNAGTTSETIVETVAEPTATPPTVAASVAPADNGSESSADVGTTVRVFAIDQSQSAASFTLDEELLGVPTTVVGTTSLVSGDITIDLANLAATTISPIQIDASDLTTDSDRRNGAIQRFILQTNSETNRYIVFTPTTIDGLPATAAVGDTFTLQISGDLTISGVTNPVIFATEITVLSDTQISGAATTQILRSDYNLSIPSVPSVANVTDEVRLDFRFVADS